MGMCPALASAAKPFVLDTTSSARTPTVAVDGNGVAHFAWTISIRGWRRHRPVLPGSPQRHQVQEAAGLPSAQGGHQPAARPRPSRWPRADLHASLLRREPSAGADPRPLRVRLRKRNGAREVARPEPRLRLPVRVLGRWRHLEPGHRLLPGGRHGVRPQYLPRVVGSVISESDIVAGPGEFSIGMVSSGTGAANFQAAPIAGFPTRDGIRLRRTARPGLPQEREVQRRRRRQGCQQPVRLLLARLGRSTHADSGHDRPEQRVLPQVPRRR